MGQHKYNPIAKLVNEKAPKEPKDDDLLISTLFIEGLKRGILKGQKTKKRIIVRGV